MAKKRIKYSALEREKALILLKKNNDDGVKTAADLGINVSLLYQWKHRADPMRSLQAPERMANKKNGLIPGKKTDDAPLEFTSMVQMAVEQKDAIKALFGPNVDDFHELFGYSYLELHEYLLAKIKQVALYSMDLDKLTKTLELTHRLISEDYSKKEDDLVGFDDNSHERGVVNIFNKFNISYNPENYGTRKQDDPKTES